MPMSSNRHLKSYGLSVSLRDTELLEQSRFSFSGKEREVKVCSPMKPQRTFVFCKSQKNVSTGIASTVITPTKWFLPRLYSNFVCNELISLEWRFDFCRALFDSRPLFIITLGQRVVKWATFVVYRPNSLLLSALEYLRYLHFTYWSRGLTKS